MIRRPPRSTLVPYTTLFRSDPGRTLDPHEHFDLQACLDHFVAQLFREVEVGGREPLGSSGRVAMLRSEEHPSELPSRQYLVCRLLLEKQINLITPIFLYPGF